MLVFQTSPLFSCLRFLFYLVTGHVSENVLLRVNRHKIFCAFPTPSRSLSAWVSGVVSGSVVVKPREIRLRKVRVRGKGFALGCGCAFWRSLYKNNLKETSTQFFNKLHHTLLLRNTTTKIRPKIQLHHSRTRKPRKPI